MCRARPAASTARSAPTGACTSCTTTLVEQRRGSPCPAATLGPVCAFVGGHVALDVLHQLTGLCEPASKGTVRVFDTRTVELSTEEVPRDPLCDVCAS
jgi:hypothetical protein